MATQEIKKIVTIDAAQSAKTLRELQAEIVRLKGNLDGLDKSTDAYQDGLVKVKKAQSDYNAEMRLAVKTSNSAKGSYNYLTAELARLKEQWKATGDEAERGRLTKEVNRVKAQLNDLDHSIGNWQRNVGNYWGSIRAGLAKMTAAIGAAILMVRKFGNAIKVIVNFEQSVKNLSTILGASTEDMKMLEEQALLLGRTTRYTASEVVGLQTELAKLGFIPAQIEKMSEATLNFATAVGTDLSSAAAMAGATLRIFGLRSEDTEDTLNVLAVATNRSALNFGYLQTAMSTIGPVANAFGFSLRDTTALLGTLANAGFDASSAATASRNILLNLADANGKLAKRLGGSVSTFEELIDALIRLREEGVDLNTTLELTDKRSVAAFNTFLDGAEKARGLRRELENVNGAVKTIAEERMKTLQGATLELKSAWQGLLLSFRESTGVIAGVVRSLTSLINKITDVQDAVNKGGTKAKDKKEQDALVERFEKVYELYGRDEMLRQYGEWEKSAAAAYDAALEKYAAHRSRKTRKELNDALNALDIKGRVQAIGTGDGEAAGQAIVDATTPETTTPTATTDKTAAKELEKKAQEEAKRLESARKAQEKAAAEAAAYLKAQAATAESERKVSEKGALADVGKGESLSILNAQAEISDAEELAARIYEIRQQAQQERLDLLQEFRQAAYERGDYDAQVEYDKQIADTELEIAKQTLQRKKELREEDAEDAKKRGQQEIAAYQAIASVMGNIASAYQAAIQQKVDAGKISKEQAENEFENVKRLQYAQTLINTLAGMMSVWGNPEGGTFFKIAQSAEVMTQGLAAAMQIANTTLSSTSAAARSVTSAAVAAPVVMQQVQQVRTLTSAQDEQVLNERSQSQRVYLVYSDVQAAGRQVEVVNSESGF